MADRIDACRTDGTPDHRGRIHGAAVGAGETVGLVGVADTVDVSQHPEGYAYLSQGAKDLFGFVSTAGRKKSGTF